MPVEILPTSGRTYVDQSHSMLQAQSCLLATGQHPHYPGDEHPLGHSGSKLFGVGARANALGYEKQNHYAGLTGSQPWLHTESPGELLKNTCAWTSP